MGKFKTQEDMARAGGLAIKKKYGIGYFKELVGKRKKKTTTSTSKRNT